VNYATADNTATTADLDYVGITSPLTLTFNPGVTSQRIGVTVNGDTKYETNETFYVNLTSPTNATISGGGQGTGTILNDDGLPQITISDTTGYEGDVGTKSFGFYVTLSSASYQTITVNYATVDNTATTADNDYVGIPITTLTFNPGETSKRVGVTVNGDVVFELNETFFVNLSNGFNATIVDNQGIGTILNDDGAHDVSVDSIIVPANTVKVCYPFNPVILVGNNTAPPTVETCTLNLKIWEFRVKIDSLCNISVNPLDTIIAYDSTVIITINPGDTAITMPPFHPTIVDLTWLSSPTYHIAAARVSMWNDAVPSNNFKQKKFVVTGRKNDLQVDNAALMRGSSILRIDTVYTGTSYNAISVVSNVGTVRATFRNYFKITRMKTSQIVYSQYLDKTLNPLTYSCIYFYTGWVPVDTGLYNVSSWITSRPGVDSTPDNNLFERHYIAVRPGASGPLSGSEEKIKVYAMYQNRPNPFFATTVIKWQIPIESKVSIAVYDATGRIIKTLVNGNFAVGYYNTTWNCTDNNNSKVSAGIYFYEMKASNYSARRKMVVTH
jgi:hypothetical protein